MQIMEEKQCVKDSNQLGEVFTSGIFLSGRNCTEGMCSKNEKYEMYAESTKIIVKYTSGLYHFDLLLPPRVICTNICGLLDLGREFRKTMILIEF